MEASAVSTTAGACSKGEYNTWEAPVWRMPSTRAVPGSALAGVVHAEFTAGVDGPHALYFGGWFFYPGIIQLILQRKNQFGKTQSLDPSR